MTLKVRPAQLRDLATIETLYRQQVREAERTPLKRACRPEDIAETIFFLCAGGAMITGQTIIVDGGLTL